MARISVLRCALLAGICLSIFFTHLGTARLWDRDEPRNARASHEMLERGDWIVPTFNGELRDHKPILLYWAQMGSYLAFGEKDFSARLPSALAALLAIASLAVLASRLSGTAGGINRDGFWAAACLATCLLFVMAGRAATPDACLIAFSTAGIAALVCGCLEPNLPFSSGRVGKLRWLPAAVGYTMLGLAALAKGPVGIILPMAVVLCWWMLCYNMQNHAGQPQEAAKSGFFQQLLQLGRQAWQSFHPGRCVRAVLALRLIPGLLLSLLAAAPWYIAVGLETNGAFLRGFFWEHNVGRAMNSMEGHHGSLFFYPLALLVGTFPWSLWLIPIIAWARTAYREDVVRRQMIILASVWIGIYIIAFSMASTKLPSYITPCYAGAALLVGGFWRQYESSWSLPALAWRRTAYALTGLVGCGVSACMLWLSASQAMPLLNYAAASGLVLVLVGCLGFAWEYRQQGNLVPATYLLGATAFHLILFGYGAVSVDRYRQDLQLLSKVKLTTQTEHWLSIGGMEPSWVHYLGDQIVEVRDDASQQESWSQVRDFLAKYPDGNLIVVGDEALRTLATQAHLPELQQVDSAKRFLRPGQLGVFRRMTQVARDTSASSPSSR